MVPVAAAFAPPCSSHVSPLTPASGSLWRDAFALTSNSFLFQSTPQSHGHPGSVPRPLSSHGGRPASLGSAWAAAAPCPESRAPYPPPPHRRGWFSVRTPSKLAALYQAPPSLWGGSCLPRLGLVGEEPGRWGRCTCSTNFGALPGVWGGGATPPRPFPSNLAKLPRQPRGRPLGQRSGTRGRRGVPGKLAPGDGAGGDERAPACTHSTHLHAAPGDTKSRSATPAVQPAGRRRPTPRPSAPRRSGGSRAAWGPQGATQGRPPSPARGYPRRCGSRVSPWAAEAGRSPGPRDQSRAPSTVLPGPGRGPRSPRLLASFLSRGAGRSLHSSPR